MYTVHLVKSSSAGEACEYHSEMDSEACKYCSVERVAKVELEQFRRISRGVTECDRELAVVAPEACFHNRQCKARPFGVVKIVALLHYDTYILDLKI